MRSLKRYLWQRIAEKSERFRRCRNCAVLLEVEREDGTDDASVLRDHLGHVLDEVTFVRFWEWVRIAWAK